MVKPLYITQQIRLAITLAKMDIKRKYSQQLLGVLWGILVPLGMAMVIGFVYGILFRVEMKELLPYLFLNLILWTFLSAAADAGATCYTSAEGYIKQIGGISYFVYPLRVAIVSGFHLLLGLVASFLVNVFFGISFSLNTIMLAPGIVVWFLLGFGMSCVSGVINTFFRDFSNLQAIALQIVFYASPILFPAKLLAERNMSALYEYNPVYHLLMIVDAPVLRGEVPEMHNMLVAVGTAVLVLFIGAALVNKAARRMVFWI